MIFFRKNSEDAVIFIKQNKNLLVDSFIPEKLRIAKNEPVSFFMAGSPGAGKTEFSKRFIEALEEPIVRIDADEIKTIIPQYKGNNSDEVQVAASIGVEKMYDYVIKHKLDVLVDGTLQSFNVALRNIQRSLDKGRLVAIFYIHQDPIIAWQFTKHRENLEGRNIPKEAFVEAYFRSKENVNKLKELFGDKIQINLVEKNYENEVERLEINVKNIDNYLKIEYDSETLKDKLIDKIV